MSADGYLPPRLFDLIRSRIEALGSMPVATKRTD
jgi:hypothetical protein